MELWQLVEKAFVWMTYFYTFHSHFFVFLIAKFDFKRVEMKMELWLLVENTFVWMEDWLRIPDIYVSKPNPSYHKILFKEGLKWILNCDYVKKNICSDSRFFEIVASMILFCPCLLQNIVFNRVEIETELWLLVEWHILAFFIHFVFLITKFYFEKVEMKTELWLFW